jgi:hypothetical protein
MWLPASLYESLPIAYAAAGTLALAFLGLSPLAVISSALLFAAGVLTYLRRRSYRAEQRSAPRRRQGRR